MKKRKKKEDREAIIFSKKSQDHGEKLGRIMRKEFYALIILMNAPVWKDLSFRCDENC